jgi:glycine dehydrogenase subunit 1
MQFLPHTQDDIAEMLQAIGIKSLDDLFQTIPESNRLKGELNLPKPLTEWELNAEMDRKAGNMACGVSDFTCFMGAGSYHHYSPAFISQLIIRQEFYTAYTPYQPEVSQGTLQAIYEFQTYVTRLMGTDVATASHYDGATALAEALLIAVRKTKKSKIAVSKAVNPNYREVVKTYFRSTDFEIVELPVKADGTTDISAIGAIDDLGGVGIQSPNYFGCIEDLQAAADKTHDKNALFVANFSEALAYGLLKQPGKCGADIVTGEGQSMGIPRSFGGPNLGMIGATQKLVRILPGRLIGRTTDVDGKDAFVMTLATREQHIRREKASSNICTNVGLNAVAALMHMAALGGTGIRKMAQINHDLAEYLKSGLKKAGLRIPFDTPTFNEFVVEIPGGAATHKKLMDKKISLGVGLEKDYPDLKDCYLLCVTETKTKSDLDRLVKEVTA